MITRFVLKDAHVPAEVVETMERRIHQRMDAYFKDEAEGDTVIGVRITEQKNTYKVEMTMPYMGHTLRTENQEREISLPARDKGIDVLERQMKKLRPQVARTEVSRFLIFLRAISPYFLVPPDMFRT